MNYTSLKLDIQNWTLNNSPEFTSVIPTIISFGQTKLEDLIMEDGNGLIFMESSPSYTPSLLKDTNSFALPANYMEMLYLALTDQLPSPVITLSSAAGTLAASTYYYRVTATNANGETLGSDEKSIILSGTGGVKIDWTAITDAAGYKVYGRSTGAELLIATISSGATITYTDSGSLTPSGSMPVFNTSGKNRYGGVDRYSSKKFGDLRGTSIDSLTKGRPLIFERKGNTLVFDSYADKNYGVDFRYWKKANALSDTNTTNEWTINAERALLYSCLAEAVPFLGDDPRSGVWLKARDGEIVLLKTRNARERLSGAKTQWGSPNVFFASSK